jgi:hypothetical protein
MEAVRICEKLENFGESILRLMHEFTTQTCIMN